MISSASKGPQPTPQIPLPFLLSCVCWHGKPQVPTSLLPWASITGGRPMPDLPVPASAEFLTVKETAMLFRVCSKTVRRWIASGDLPATRPGRDWRIDRRDLRSLAARRSNRVAGNVL